MSHTNFKFVKSNEMIENLCHHNINVCIELSTVWLCILIVWFMNVTPIGMYSDRRNKCINEGAIIICYQTLHDINWLYNYLLLVTFVLESGTRLTVSDAVQIIMRFIWFDKFKICMRYQSLCPHSIRLFMWFLYATWQFMPAFYSFIRLLVIFMPAFHSLLAIFMWFLYAQWEFMPAFHSYIGHFYVMNIPSEFVSFIGEMQISKWLRKQWSSSMLTYENCQGMKKLSEGCWLDIAILLSDWNLLQTYCGGSYGGCIAFPSILLVKLFCLYGINYLHLNFQC